MKHKLSSNYAFAIEPYKKRLRLIVYKSDEELVCRKENKNNLLNFLSDEESQHFKGRLQLKKADDIIVVQAKGEAVGKIARTDFHQLFNDV